MHKALVNIICAFVPDRWKRHELREKLTTKSKHQQLIEEFRAMACLIKAQSVHKETFGPYRGIHTGGEVVVMGTGPTLKHYVPIPGAIHIGTNAAFKWDKAKLDYLFLQDGVFVDMPDRNNPPRGWSYHDINRYDGDGCVKFYGIAQRMLMEKTPTIRLPLADVIEAGARPFILEDPERNSIAYDLTYEPMGCYSSIVHSAFQFAMFTNPKRIYLVGCDCAFSSGKRGQHNTFGSAYGLIRDWRIFKKHLDENYPELEVVSINPVGLQGLFTDMFTADKVDLQSMHMETLP